MRKKTAYASPRVSIWTSIYFERPQSPRTRHINATLRERKDLASAVTCRLTRECLYLTLTRTVSPYCAVSTASRRKDFNGEIGHIRRDRCAGVGAVIESRPRTGAA